jgi:hypothetical protein
MRPLLVTFSIALVFGFTGCSGDGSSDNAAGGGEPAAATSIEVACGHCIYKMEGLEQCTSACKVEGKTLLLEGPGTDAQALMAAGFCEGPLMADVEGKVEGDKYVVTSLKLKEKEK